LNTLSILIYTTTTPQLPQEMPFHPRESRIKITDTKHRALEVCMPPKTPPNAIITSAHTADDETERKQGNREKKCMCLIWYPANTGKNKEEKGKWIRRQCAINDPDNPRLLLGSQNARSNINFLLHNSD
jgi:hypothetical protein